MNVNFEIFKHSGSELVIRFMYVHLSRSLVFRRSGDSESFDLEADAGPACFEAFSMCYRIIKARGPDVASLIMIC
jgi:hypothetical protein